LRLWVQGVSSELVLVVDDEPSIVQLSKLYLERDGYRVIEAGDGKTALEMIWRERPALVLLDIMLPEVDGLEVCRTLRAEKNQVPVIMVSARDEDLDKILGLELGADDYLTKPFNPRELVARVKALLRRSSLATDTEIPAILHFGDLTIDPARREATVNGKPIDLRTQEFEVLLVLARNRSIVMTREKLLNLAWGFDFAGETRTVDMHVSLLRHKLCESSVQIETVTGIGYKLVA
jgi:two-component system, OmpR family, alkaline phosphatase synthesis response regulator PhoP